MKQSRWIIKMSDNHQKFPIDFQKLLTMVASFRQISDSFRKTVGNSDRPLEKNLQFFKKAH